MRPFASLLILAPLVIASAAWGDSWVASPFNADERFKILDLVHRVESMEGAVEDLQVQETETEVRLELAADVLFEFDQAELRPVAEETLRKASEYLEQYATGAVRIDGHTDGKGSDTYNERLSVRRAESVRRWFEEHGHAGRKFTVKGWGARQPVAPNHRPDGGDDPEGRMKNRRVEIIITK